MDQDITCGPDRVRRIMTERQLRAIQPKSYTSKTNDARRELFAYIESYYNTHRKQSALKYRTTTQFEAA